ncbi:MAG: TatD family hydrolase [Candidatus Krumholzibacteriia bacterium]
MLVDSHLHLGRADYAADREAVLARAEAAGVTRFLEVGYDLESSERAAALAGADGRFRAAVGIHPHDAARLAGPDGRLAPDADAVLARLAALAAGPRVVAIGEIGLDFFRDLSPRPAQVAAFRAQLALAGRLGLPVILHVRDAYPEALALLEAEGLPERRGVLHAFAGDASSAAWARRHGFRLGIGGPVTYRHSLLPDLLRGVAPDDLLLETDAPWLPPQPHRGRRNEPAWLRLTAEAVAGLCGLPLEELAARTTAACEALFGAVD